MTSAYVGLHKILFPFILSVFSLFAKRRRRSKYSFQLGIVQRSVAHFFLLSSDVKKDKRNALEIIEKNETEVEHDKCLPLSCVIFTYK